jgi:UDP-N-acetylglucosamine 3-dehydrogenase
VERIRAGVIGVGAMGRHHVRVLAENDATELVGIADLDEMRATELAAKYGCARYADYRHLLDEKLDLVVVAAPTSLHHTIGVEVLKSGAHAFIEKPIADTVEGARAIARTAQDAGKLVFVGHIERFNPVVSVVKDVMDEGRLGEVLSISNLRVGQLNQRIFDVGIVLDLGTHDIDMISHLYGRRAESVYCVGLRKVGNFEDHASLLLKFPGGRTGIIETSWLMPYKVRKMLVTGEKGFLLADLVTRKIVLMEDKFIEEIPCEEEEPLKRQLRSVVDSILNGAPPAVGADDSTYTLAVALASVESYRTNSVVQIRDIETGTASSK